MFIYTRVLRIIQYIIINLNYKTARWKLRAKNVVFFFNFVLNELLYFTYKYAQVALNKYFLISFGLIII